MICKQNMFDAKDPSPLSDCDCEKARLCKDATCPGCPGAECDVDSECKGPDWMLDGKDVSELCLPTSEFVPQLPFHEQATISIWHLRGRSIFDPEMVKIGRPMALDCSWMYQWQR